MENPEYTLIITCYGEVVVVRSGNSLPRLTTALYALLSYGIPHSVGKVVQNSTGEVVRYSHRDDVAVAA